MEKFVHNENLKLYRKLLAETTDAQKRQTLLKLLADEEAKEAQFPEKTGADARFLELQRSIIPRDRRPRDLSERRLRSRSSSISSNADLMRWTNGVCTGSPAARNREPWSRGRIR